MKLAKVSMDISETKRKHAVNGSSECIYVHAGDLHVSLRVLEDLWSQLSCQRSAIVMIQGEID